jgi:dTDP-4-dehydrorhamnose reductase
MGFFTDELRSPLSVRDLAAALLECVARPELHGPLHLAGPDTVSRLELAQLVCRQHGLDPSGLRGSLAAALPDPRPRDCSLDSSRAAALLATRIRGIREVLA